LTNFVVDDSGKKTNYLITSHANIRIPKIETENTIYK